MFSRPHAFAILWLAIGCGVASDASIAAAQSALTAVKPESLKEILPSTPADCTAERLRRVRAASLAITDEVALRSEQLSQVPAVDVMDAVRPVLDLDAAVEEAVREILKLRTQFQDSPRGDMYRQQIRNYLAIAEQLIALDGKMNYLQRDTLDTATYLLASRTAELQQLTELLTEKRSVPGAAMMSFVLDDPDPASGLKPYPPAMRSKVLDLMAAARTLDVVSVIGRFVQQPRVDPLVRLRAIEVLKHIGIPQDPHPQQDPAIKPPPITAATLLKVAEGIELPATADGLQRQRRDSLIQWLRQRVAKGVVGDRLRVGRIEVREGDWFLMRNPSPFNLFTDLSPGLFTHVGIVTTLTDDRGIRRFVVTDIPERGDRVPATNVDAYVHTPLHYVFLRHEDAAVNKAIASAAADTVGSPSQFDLLFRTDRVTQLKGKSLRGQLVHTYCAGYLLLCAQQSGLPRSEFFPISEYAPSERCQQNLAKLGVRIGQNYISPTGPLFSKKHRIIGGRKPFYNPAREVSAAVFDHFGQQMKQRELTPSPDLFQSLRSKVAGLSRYNPWLARALAKANNVSPRMDLEAAAAAAAVIETLDEIADTMSEEFRFARLVLMNADEDLRDLPATDLKRVPIFRQRHSQLDRSMEEGSISTRELRIALVKYYEDRGRAALDARFFTKK